MPIVRPQPGEVDRTEAVPSPSAGTMQFLPAPGGTLAAGDRLEVGLAQDQALREQRRLALVQRLRQTRSLERLGIEGCAAVGLALPFYGIGWVFAVRYGYYVDAPSPLWECGLGLTSLLLVSLLLALGSPLVRKLVVARGRRQAVEIPCAPVSSPPVEGTDWRSLLRRHLLQEIERTGGFETRMGTLCVSAGLATLALWLGDLVLALDPDPAGHGIHPLFGVPIPLVLSIAAALRLGCHFRLIGLHHEAKLQGLIVPDRE